MTVESMYFVMNVSHPSTGCWITTWRCGGRETLTQTSHPCQYRMWLKTPRQCWVRLLVWKLILNFERLGTKQPGRAWLWNCIPERSQTLRVGTNTDYTKVMYCHQQLMKLLWLKKSRVWRSREYIMYYHQPPVNPLWLKETVQALLKLNHLTLSMST